MDKKNLTKFKQEIKQKMKEKEISQDKLAKILNIKKKSLQTYLSKNNPIPILLIDKLKKMGFISNQKEERKKSIISEIKIKELEEKIKKLEIEYKIRKMEFEKLERTSGARSQITWACIDIQKYISSKIIEIGNIYNLADRNVQITSSNALKQLSNHLKKLANNIDEIVIKNDEIIIKEEIKMQNAYDKYNVKIPKKNFNVFDIEDQIKILTFKVGKVVPRILKELNVRGEFFTARKTSLLINGKIDKREEYKMKNYIAEYGDFFEDLSDNISNALGDILEEIITDMLKYNKNEKRKKAFFDLLDSVLGLQLIFTVGIISIGEYLINTQGYIKNGRYLEQVLLARKELSNKIKDIFKKMNKEEYTEEETKAMFRSLIENKVQELVKIDMELYDEIRFEEQLAEMCEETSINNFIIELVDYAREKATNRPRLIEMSGVDTNNTIF
ncbi:MAG: hypothetical protein SOY60_06815 [Fusobacterium gastrosuis]|uniref:hypothetical protein n=1 Tax=Fusobacterium gastrosuis TaxID=1755100 RepID=UPI002A8AFCC8|nr:hypothetical protein [Fusobacterium gastrosuis]